MVELYELNDAESTSRQGYLATYVADLVFSGPTESAGVIMVELGVGAKTEPHAHEHLQEVFIALGGMKAKIADKEILLHRGDVLLVEPNEYHSFETHPEQAASLIAIKVPNLKDDKKKSK